MRRVNTVRSVMACALLCAAFTARSLAQTPEGQVDAYVQVIKAEQAEKSGELETALGHYRSALKLYQQVQENNPEWSPDLVRYRIADSLNHVKRLELSLGTETKSSKTEAKAADKPVNDSAREIERLTKKEAELSRELNILADQNQKAREDNERLALQVQDLITINENLIRAAKAEEAEEPASRKEIRAAVKEASKKNRAEISSLKDERSALQDEVSDLRDQLESLQRSSAKELENEQKTAAKKLIAHMEESDAMLEQQREAAADERKAMERAHADQLTDLERQLAALEKERESLAKKIEGDAEDLEKSRSYRRAMKKAESENGKLLKDLEETTRALDEARTEIARLTPLAEARPSDELEQLRKENSALKETIDLNQEEIDRVRAYKKEIKGLEKANSRLEDDLKDLQKKYEKNDLAEEYALLKSQNDILVDEVQQFRSQLLAAEKTIRKLEQIVGEKEL